MNCNKGMHEIRGPNDRGAHGEGIHCIRDRGRRHAAVRAEALTLFRALEDRGVPADIDHLVEGSRLLAALDLARNPAIPR